MDSLLVTITLILFVFGPLMQPDLDRLFVASVYIYGNVFVHEAMFSSLDGLAYYGSAALTDLLTITLLCTIVLSTKLCGKLISVCMISIILNFGGWLIWLGGLEPMVYNLSFVVLNAYTIYLLIGGDSEHGRLGASDGRTPIIWSYLVSSRKQSSEL